MPSTSAPTSPTFAGYTALPGLQVSPFGAVISNVKCYNFGVTDTGVISATSTDRSYSVSGLTTSDLPISLVPSTGNPLAGIGAMWCSAANTLNVRWVQNGTSTSGIPGLTAPGAAYTVFTLSYANQSSSTTT